MVANKEKLLEYIDFSGWRIPINQTIQVGYSIIFLKGKVPTNEIQCFQSSSSVTISRVDELKSVVHKKRLKEIQEQNAIKSLQEYVWDTLSNDCLIHPKLLAFKEDGQWVVMPEEAKAHNKYWKSMAKEVLSDGNFLVSVKNVEAFNPKTQT